MSAVFEHAVLKGTVVGCFESAGIKPYRAVAAVHVPASCSEAEERWSGGKGEDEDEGRVE